MNTSRFEIAFEGQPFNDGEIDVRDLAPTLLSLGNVVQAANRALNGERADARLKVAATKEGSFVAALMMDVSWVTDMLDAVVAHQDRIVAAEQIVDLLIKVGGALGGTVGLFQALKRLNGKRPESVLSNQDGTTSLTCGAITIVVDDNTLKLLQDLPTREAVEALGAKAGRVKGLETLKLGYDAKKSASVTFSHDDLPALKVPEVEEEPDVAVTHRDAWLRIVSLHFRDGYKWRFSDGGERPFTAEMEDTDFQSKVQDGAVALNANDTIRCRLREEQSLSAASLLKTVIVEKVLDYREGARQLNLL